VTVAAATCEGSGLLTAATAMAVTSAACKRLDLLAATAVAMASAATAAGAAGESRSAASAATMSATISVTATTALRRGLSTTVRTTTPVAVVSATASAVRSRDCRGCDRQRGTARGENDPGQHEKSPSERDKRSVRFTVPTPKRRELSA
jgi:hypothetical protein